MNNKIPFIADRKTGISFAAVIKEAVASKLPKRGWNFNWREPKKRGYKVFILSLDGSDEIQGLIAIRDDADNHAINIDIIESAPHNVGVKGKYEGVGPLLFAFAGKQSIDKGYHLVYFDAKTGLIDYYKQKLGAKQIGKSQRMILEGCELYDLVSFYYGNDE